MTTFRQPYSTDESRWAAVLARDAAADGSFYFAVKTTGVFCLPSCSSRRARHENVTFFTTATEAQAAGFRACKRCEPTGPTRAEDQAAAVAKACRSIESAETAPGLRALAQAAGMSPFHFHRVFKATAGVTPKEYAKAIRSQRLRAKLSECNTVTVAIYDAGFGSSGRFYEQSTAALGMTPTLFRKGGAGRTIRFAVGQCSLGAVLVAMSERGVCAISLGDEPGMLVRELQDQFSRAELLGGDAGFERTVAQVIGFIETPALGLNLPLDIRGTAFQQRVWKALQEIPPGSTASYTAIAARLGLPKAVRAIAGACAANRLAVVIPCHRVVRQDGNLSGYRWGIARKSALLQREAAKR